MTHWRTRLWVVFLPCFLVGCGYLDNDLFLSDAQYAQTFDLDGMTIYGSGSARYLSRRGYSISDCFGWGHAAAYARYYGYGYGYASGESAAGQGGGAVAVSIAEKDSQPRARQRAQAQALAGWLAAFAAKSDQRAAGVAAVAR